MMIACRLRYLAVCLMAVLIALATPGCERGEDGFSDPSGKETPQEPIVIKPDSVAVTNKELDGIVKRLAGAWEGSLSTQWFNDYGEIVAGTYEANYEFEPPVGTSYQGKGLETLYQNGTRVWRMSFEWSLNEKGHIRFVNAEGRGYNIKEYHLTGEAFSGTYHSDDMLETCRFDMRKQR